MEEPFLCVSLLNLVLSVSIEVKMNLDIAVSHSSRWSTISSQQASLREADSFCPLIYKKLLPKHTV